MNEIQPLTIDGIARLAFSRLGPGELAQLRDGKQIQMFPLDSVRKQASDAANILRLIYIEAPDEQARRAPVDEVYRAFVGLAKQYPERRRGADGEDLRTIVAACYRLQTTLIDQWGHDSPASEVLAWINGTIAIAAGVAG